MKSLEPIGIDRWAVELNLKLRDIFGCPIGGRWLFAYWSPRRLQLAQDQRALLYLGGAFATAQIQKLAPPFAARLGKGAHLTPRELSVLRSLSLGRRVTEISKDLGLGEETCAVTSSRLSPNSALATRCTPSRKPCACG